MSNLLMVLRAGMLCVTIAALLLRTDCAFVAPTCRVGHVFSYFTVHSTVLFALVLAVSLLLRGKEPPWLTAARALAAAYLLVSGLTFGMMVSSADLIGHVFLVPLSSKVMHFMLPIYAILEFLFAPGGQRLRWRTVSLSLAPPLIWSAAILMRGDASGWYPYFFLDPGQVGGYQEVAAYAAILAALIVTASSTLVALNRVTTDPP